MRIKARYENKVLKTLGRTELERKEK